jgi:hypothetical protein
MMEMTKMMSAEWRALTAAQKAPYLAMADKDKVRYQKEKAAWDSREDEELRPAAPAIGKKRRRLSGNQAARQKQKQTLEQQLAAAVASTDRPEEWQQKPVFRALSMLLSQRFGLENPPVANSTTSAGGAVLLPSSPLAQTIEEREARLVVGEASLVTRETMLVARESAVAERERMAAVREQGHIPGGFH